MGSGVNVSSKSIRLQVGLWLQANRTALYVMPVLQVGLLAIFLAVAVLHSHVQLVAAGCCACAQVRPLLLTRLRCERQLVEEATSRAAPASHYSSTGVRNAHDQPAVADAEGR